MYWIIYIQNSPLKLLWKNDCDKTDLHIIIIIIIIIALQHSELKGWEPEWTNPQMLS